MPRDSLYAEPAGPVHSNPGGAWGAEESGFEIEPGPEATVKGLASQGGVRLTKVRQHYESINESVTPRGSFVAHP